MQSAFTRFKTSFLMPIVSMSLLFSGCTTLTTKTVVYSEHELNDKLGTKLLFEKRLVQIFKVRTINPKISLDADKNRVKLALDIQVQNSLNLDKIQGTVFVSGELGFDPEKRRVIVKNPRVEKLDVPHLDQALHFSATSLLLDWINQAMVDVPIYDLKPSDLRFLGVQFDPKALLVVPQGLSITVAPR